jgi:hypothetical protein
VTPAGRSCALAAAAALAGAALGGCRQSPETRRLRAEARVLERQIASLRELLDRAEKGTLVDAGWLALAVGESAFQSVLEAGLPHERLVAERWHTRVHRATVRFEGGAGLVSLNAQVRDTTAEGRVAEVVFRGGLGRIEVSPRGRLQTHVVVDHIEVAPAQASGADAAFAAGVVDELAGRNLELVEDLVPPVDIPVRLQQRLAFDGLREGPIEVDAGELPVTVRVARILPLSGRLWIFLDVAAGPWQASPPAAPAPKASP